MLQISQLFRRSKNFSDSPGSFWDIQVESDGPLGLVWKWSDTSISSNLSLVGHIFLKRSWLYDTTISPAGNLLIRVFCKGFTLKRMPIHRKGNVLIFHWSYFNYCIAKLGKGRRKSYIRLGAVLWNQRGHEKCFLCCYICGQAYFCFIHTTH